MTTNNISPQQLQTLIEKGEALQFIDVRTPLEFQEVHLAEAENIPLDQLNPEQLQSKIELDKPLYVICRSGNRASQACKKLNSAGFDKLMNVEGGMLACEQAGLKLIRGKKVMSLERQVRIAAGFLVVLGVLLGWQLHPAFLGLSAFVGAGLMFAGITDTCGMGMLLAKMPWNKVAN